MVYFSNICAQTFCTNIFPHCNQLTGFSLMFILSLNKHKMEIYNSVKNSTISDNLCAVSVQCIAQGLTGVTAVVVTAVVAVSIVI